MLRSKLGKLLLVSLGFLSLEGCRNSVPPRIEICLADGFGGADCVEADGTKLYRSPSELTDYWMTNQIDMANFSSWCYQTDQNTVNIAMKQIMQDTKP